MAKDFNEQQGTVMEEDTPVYTHNSFDVVYTEYQRLSKKSKKYIWIAFNDRVWDKAQKDKK